jgi:glycosyltransferase involved in cell wall biosynthesis
MLTLAIIVPCYNEQEVLPSTAQRLSEKIKQLVAFLHSVCFCVIMIAWFIYRYFSGHTIASWASSAVSLRAINGLIIFSIGIVGEYIRKIHLETKHRPRYLIEQFIHK